MGNADKIIGKTTRRRAPAARVDSPPDDGRLREVLAGIWSYPAFLVAHQIKLFDLLSARPLTLEQIAGAKGLQRRPAEARATIETWRTDYNYRRPHSSLGALMPFEFVRLTSEKLIPPHAGKNEPELYL